MSKMPKTKCLYCNDYVISGVVFVQIIPNIFSRSPIQVPYSPTYHKDCFDIMTNRIFDKDFDNISIESKICVKCKCHIHKMVNFCTILCHKDEDDIFGEINYYVDLCYNCVNNIFKNMTLINYYLKKYG